MCNQNDIQDGKLKAFAIKECNSTYYACTNLIGNISDSSFKTDNCKYNSITQLNLFFNNISDIRYIHFSSLVNLTRINLNRNLIRTVNRLVFSNNKKLKYINLSYNKITNYFLNIDHLASLNYLDISHNGVTSLNLSLFKTYVQRGNDLGVRHLVLSNNSLTCTCDMLWLADLELSYNLTITYLYTDKCIYCLLENECTSVGVFNKSKCGRG